MVDCGRPDSRYAYTVKGKMSSLTTTSKRDIPGGNAQRTLKFPPAPRPAKPPRAPPERWTIEFSGRDTGVPVVCRVRRLLKMAWRGYGLRAKILAGPEPVLSPSIRVPPPDYVAACAARQSTPTATIPPPDFPAAEAARKVSDGESHDSNNATQ